MRRIENDRRRHDRFDDPEDAVMAAAHMLRRALPALIAVSVFLRAQVQADQPREVFDDPFPVQSEWKGKFTQGGTTPEGGLHPPEVNAVLTVTERAGNNFEAELREYSGNLDITFLVRGRLSRGPDKSLALEFKSHGVKGVPNVAIYYLNVPYHAKLTGDALKGSWTYEEKDNETSLAGEFDLKRSLD
jgi:hypothetical protein